jgi:hypothetical protein
VQLRGHLRGVLYAGVFQEGERGRVRRVRVQDTGGVFADVPDGPMDAVADGEQDYKGVAWAGV